MVYSQTENCSGAVTIKAREFDILVRKLDLLTRDGGDRLAWFEYDGKLITRTRRSHCSGDIPMAHSVRQQLKLNEDELRGVLACHLGKDDYINILKKKGLIEDAQIQR
jgi:hypothetical protein